MIFQYKFVTGEEVTVDVDFNPKISAVIMRQDEIERDKERRETRRHESLYKKCFETHKAPDNTEHDALRNIDIEALKKGIARLNPDEQFLINRLYLDAHTVTQAKLAVELGIDPATIRQRVVAVRKKLKQTLLKPDPA